MTPALQTGVTVLVCSASLSLLIFTVMACIRWVFRDGSVVCNVLRARNCDRVGELERKTSTRVAYLCDGTMTCGSSPNCYKNLGVCRHTLDIDHARNFDKLMEEGLYSEKEVTK